MVVLRKKRIRINGMRSFFRCGFGGEEMFVAKMKHMGSRTIPIACGDKIHLGCCRNYAGMLVIENSRTDFTLKEFAETMRPLLAVQYGAKMARNEGRKVRLTFPGDCNLPCPLTAREMSYCELMKLGDELGSSKNTIFGDEKGKVTMIVRKLGKDILEVVSELKLPPLWLFSIGIASFLGRKPRK
jgi:hypothetical protein